MKKLIYIGIFLSLLFSVDAQASNTDIIQIDHTFTVKFSHSVQADFISEKYFQLYDAKGAIAIEVVHGPLANQVILKPKQLLQEDTFYTVVVKEDVKNILGNQMAKGYSKQFKTATSTNTNQLQDVQSIQKANTLLASFRHLETMHVNVYYSQHVQENMGEKYAINFEEQVYPLIQSFLRPTLESHSKPIFVLLTEAERYQYLKQLDGSQKSLGWYHQQLNMIVLIVNESVDTSIMAHEYVHWLVANEYGIQVPLWFNEGLAFHFASTTEATYEPQQHLSNLMKQIEVQGINKEFINYPYTNEANAIVAYLIGEGGMEKFQLFLKRQRVVSFERALFEYYQYKIEDFVPLLLEGQK